MLFKRRITKTYSFPRKFFVFSLIVTLCIVSATLLLGFFLYTSQKKNMDHRIQMNANRIEREINALFNETNRIMVYVGKQIAAHDPSDVEFISNTLVNFTDVKEIRQSFYSWTFFSWIDSCGLQVLDSDTGINKNPPDMSNRSYMEKSRRVPLKLHVSPPAIGIPRGIWCIPAAVGIRDKEGVYLGALATEFSVKELNYKLQSLVSPDEVSFLVFDKNWRIILQSEDNSIDPKSLFYRKKFEEKSPFTDEEGFLKKGIFNKDISYNYYKKMKKYPYVILTGFRKNYISKEMTTFVTPRIIEFFMIGLFFLLLFYFITQKIGKLSKQSDEEKEKFISQIKEENDKNFKNILNSLSKSNKMLEADEELKINHFIELIRRASFNTNAITREGLNRKYIDVSKTIEQCIIIHTKKAFRKNIVIKTNFLPSLPPFYVDELRFKQVILGVLNHSMDSFLEHGEISISTHIKFENERNFLEIVISDNGFNLSESEISMIRSRLEPEVIQTNFDGTILTSEAVKKIIKIHNGKYEVKKSKYSRGKVVKIMFPYLDPKNTNPPEEQEESNVLNFFDNNRL